MKITEDFTFLVQLPDCAGAWNVQCHKIDEVIDTISRYILLICVGLFGLKGDTYFKFAELKYGGQTR